MANEKTKDVKAKDIITGGKKKKINVVQWLFPFYLSIFIIWELLNWQFGWNTQIVDKLSTVSVVLIIVVSVLIAMFETILPLALLMPIAFFRILGINTWWLIMPMAFGCILLVLLCIKYHRHTTNKPLLTTSFLFVAFLDFEIVTVLPFGRYLNKKPLFLASAINFIDSSIQLFVLGNITMGNGFPFIVVTSAIAFAINISISYHPKLRKYFFEKRNAAELEGTKQNSANDVDKK
jgi:hypothetical protein